MDGGGVSGRNCIGQAGSSTGASWKCISADGLYELCLGGYLETIVVGGRSVVAMEGGIEGAGPRLTLGNPTACSSM